ncbi:MAG TPA: response regulator [Terriglobales bacterium]|nr:response regulator [Terriglobales bacterium]
MKRRILLVDDDLAVLLTLKAVLELHDFEVETASNTAEAISHLESRDYHMVISDLHMETEKAGLEVIRAARRQSYNPATAILTAYPPFSEDTGSDHRHRAEYPESMLIKPLGTTDLVRQIEALLIRHADSQQFRRRRALFQAHLKHRSAS